MFAVGAMMLNSYTMMANNMAFRGMMANNARLSMISNMGSIPYTPQNLAAINAMDTQLEIDSLNCGLQYKYAKKMIEQLKALQKENIERSFSTFA
jgi:hypothetical protein